MVYSTISIADLIQRITPDDAAYFPNGKVLVTKVEGLSVCVNPVKLSAVTALVCLSGEIDGRINLKKYHVVENDMFICLPGDMLQIHSADNVQAYAVLLSSDYLNEMHIDLNVRTDTYMAVRNNAVTSLSREDIMELAPYFTLLQKYLRKNNPQIVRGLVQALAHTIIALRKEHMPEKNVEDYARETRAQQIFDRFIYLLDSYHTKERCLKFYAGKMALTTKYMSLMIKAYSGKSALEWLNEYVIMEARLLLDYTDLTVQEISYRLNFPTQSAFGKYFRQQVGVSPKSYRLAGGR